MTKFGLKLLMSWRLAIVMSIAVLIAYRAAWLAFKHCMRELWSKA